MPRSNFGRFKDGFAVKGITLQVPHTGRTYYVNNSTTAAELQPFGVGGSDGNSGLTPEQPFATIDAAINKCAAGRGDTIFVLPGHAETVTNATGIIPDVNGIRIIGLGTGEKRPIITFTTNATANIPVSGANIRISGLVFKCNVASQAAMITTTADDIEIDNCSFREGTSTGLNFITVGAADGDSDRLYVHDCDFYMPTAGNGDHAIEILFDMANIRLEDLEIDGDFDEGGILIPAAGDAQVNLQIRRCNVKNRLTNIGAIDIDGTGSSGLIQDCLLRTDTQATALDSGSLAVDNVRWADETDQVAAVVSVIAPQDSVSNAIGFDDADNAFASTNVADNEDGSVLERLEYIQEGVSKGTGTEVAANKSLVDAIGFDGNAVVAASAGMVRTMAGTTFVVKKALTSSAIVGAGVDVTGASSVGDIEILNVIVNADGTGLAAGTNFTLNSNNAKGGTTAFFSTAVSGLGANGTISTTTASVTKGTHVLESTKKIVAKCTAADCTGTGTVDVYLVCRRLADNATLAAA